MTNLNESSLITDIRQVLLDSDYHKDWDEYDYQALIYSAFHYEHALLVLSSEGDPIGLCTWAFLDKDRAEQYASTGVVYHTDFEGEDGEGWVIDFAAPYGHCRQVVRILRNYFKDRYGPRVAGKIYRPWKNHLGTMYTAWGK